MENLMNPDKSKQDHSVARTLSKIHGLHSKIPKESCLRTFYCRRRSRFSKMLDRANSMISRQLDLVKYIKFQKMKWMTVMTVLKPSQMLLIDKLSKMLIHESSDLH